MSSKAIYEMAKKVMVGGVSSPVRKYDPFPRCIREGKGSKLRDVDGRTYIDYCMGFGPLILGHGDRRVIERVKDQLEKGVLFGASTELEADLAKKIIRHYPGIETVRFVSTGGEATMSAIRLARGFTGRKKIVKVDGGYHGAHDSVLVKAGSGAQTHSIPNSKGVLPEASKYTLLVPFNDPVALEGAFKREKEVSAFIVEPVMGNMGVIPPEDDYLKRVRELCDSHDVLLIFDEIITGFRLSLGGAQTLYQVVPDITTLGKIAGGGFPMGILGGGKIMEELSPIGAVYQAGTFSGNPISTTAGLATLEILEKEGYDMLDSMALMLRRGLEEIIEDKGYRCRVQGVGSMFTVFMNPEKVSNSHEARKSDLRAYMRLHGFLLDHGVYLPPGQFESCFLSMAHEKEDIDETLRAFEEGLNS